jgi:hypothetical protein
MATVWYRDHALVAPVADALNALKAQLGAGPAFHLDAYERPVLAPDASAADFLSVSRLLNEVRAVHEDHKTDLLAHKFKGPPIQTLRVTDLPRAIATANALKADINLHISVAAIHYNVDTANAVGAPDATDLASVVVLANALKAGLNAHMRSAPPAPSIRVLDP